MNLNLSKPCRPETVFFFVMISRCVQIEIQLSYVFPTFRVHGATVLVNFQMCL